MSKCSMEAEDKQLKEGSQDCESSPALVTPPDHTEHQECDKQEANRAHCVEWE